MAMVRSAVKKSRRKSQREAARLQKQADAVLAMEENEEIHFNRPETIPDTPRVSRNNTPDPEDEDRGERDYTVVLEMVKAVRDRLAALILDNTNIRAACDDLRRQCHSQGVAFGDLSRLVKQSREDQEETRAYAQEETRPHPRIRPELIDGGGNLRAEDIGITWQDRDTFLHGVRIAGRREDMEDNRRRPATAAPYPPCPEEIEDARRRPAMSTPYPQSCGRLSGDTSTPGFPHPVCIEMSDTPAHHFAGPRQELRQELISEQFVRGQSDPELKKYMWVVIRTQKDKKLQTLIEVCTDFASLSQTTNVHRPAEQVFTLEEDDDREEEMFAVVDRQQWNTQRAAEPPLSPELQQMFALARRMGYEMRQIARRFDAPRRTPGPQSTPNRDYRAPFQPRDYSRTKCFSCGQLGHTQVRCPKPDSSLPFRPSGWVDWSDGPQRRSEGPPQGNEK